MIYSTGTMAAMRKEVPPSPIKNALLDGSVRRDGFLGAGFDEVIEHCRAQHRAWFDLADGLNRLTMRLLWSLTPSKRSNQQMLVTILLGRCLSAHQATVLLSERGAILESRYVLRAMLETTFAIAANARNAEFCQRYIDDDSHRHLELVKSCLRLEPELKKFHELEDADLWKKKDDAQRVITKTGSKPLKVKDVAMAAGMEGHYETIYRLLSNTAHASVRDLDYHIVPTPDDADIEKLGWGPQVSKSADPLMQACDYLFIASRAVLDLFERPELDNQFAALHRRFEKLLKATS